MKQVSYIIMVILLSLSIVTPSVLSICSEHYDIEIAKDLGEEENKKEAKKKLEPKDPFFESFVTPQLAKIEDIKLYHDTYTLGESLFTAKIYLPPPEPTT